MLNLFTKKLCLFKLLLCCCFSTIYTTTNAQTTDYDFTACYGDTLVLPATLPQECPLGPLPIEVFDFLNPISNNYDEIVVIVIGEGTFTYDLSSVGGDCPPIIYNYNISYDANCTNTPVVTEFDFDVCIGDTITAPAIPTGTCPLGAYPPEAEPDGDNYIIEIISINSTEISFIALGTGSFSYQLPQITSSVDGLPCPSDIYRYNITIKDDCNIQPSNGAQGPTGLEIDFPSLYSIVDTNNCCDNQTVSIYRDANGIIFLYVEPNPDCSNNSPTLYDDSGALVCTGSSTTDCLTSYDITLHSYTWTCVTDEECECMSDLDAVYDIDGNEYANPCIAQCAGVEYYDEIYFTCPGDSVNLVGEVISKFCPFCDSPGSLAESFPSWIGVDCNGCLSVTVAPTETTTYTAFTEGIACFDPCGPTGPAGVSASRSFAVIVSDANCEPNPEPDTFVCLGDEVGVLIEGPQVLPPGPQGPDGQVSCTNVTNVSISPNEGVISQTSFGFYVSPTSTTSYTITSTAGLQGPSGGCTPQTVTRTFTVGVTQNCDPTDLVCPGDTIMLLSPPLGPYGPQPEGCETLVVTPDDGNIISLPNGEGFLVIASTTTVYTMTRTGVVGFGCYPEAFEISQDTNVEVNENCTTEPGEPCVVTDPLSLPFVQDAISGICPGDCGLKQIDAFSFEGSTYIRMFYAGEGPNCPTDSGGNVYLDCDGNTVCTSTPFVGSDCTNEFIAATAMGEGIWSSPYQSAVVCQQPIIDILDYLANLDWEQVVAAGGPSSTDDISLIEYNANGLYIYQLTKCDSNSTFAFVDCNGNVSDQSTISCVGPADANVLIECGDPIDLVCDVEDPLTELPWLDALKNDPCILEIYAYNYEGNGYIFAQSTTECLQDGTPSALYQCDGTEICNFAGGSGCDTGGVPIDDIPENLIYESDTCYCSPNDQPVCGADGNTYANSCEAECAGVEVVFNAECTLVPTYCVGDTVMLLTPPQGPLGPQPAGCEILTVTPDDGNIITLPDNGGFMVVVTTTTTYTVTRTGVVGLGCYSEPFEIGIDTYIEINENCPTEPEPCVVADPLSLPFIQEIISYPCADDCGRIDEITAFGYNGNTYFGLYNNILAENCTLDGGVTYLDCNGDFFCSASALPGTSNACSNEFNDIASNGTIIWSNSNTCHDEVDPEAPDTGYDWLDDLLDANDCCTNASAIEFPMGSYSFIYVKAGADCGSLGTLYLNTGQSYCTDADNFDCLGAYGLSINQGNVLWSCGDGSEPTEPTEPTEPDTQYDWLNDLLSSSDCCNANAAIEFPLESYSFIYVKADADCGGLGTLYLNTGQLYCTDADNFDCLGAYGLNESNGTTIWTCGDGPVDPPNPTTPNTGYDWLNNLIIDDGCCNANAAIEFPMGPYSFIYVLADADCGGLGSLYLNTGQLYCNDADNFDCLGAYGLSINQGNVLWNCEGGGPTEPNDPTEPVDFEDYPWLNNIVDANDCCINESVIVFPMGSYSFVYVNAGANCGGLGALYLNTGELYCTDADNFDCLGAYGLNESDGNVIWTCGTDDKPVDNADDMINEDLTEQSSKLDNTENLSSLDNVPVEMKVYPNPSIGLVNISLNTTHEGDQLIRVLDLSGRTINEFRFTDARNQVFQVNLTDLPDGLYLIEYSNINISSVEKVMVRH